MWFEPWRTRGRLAVALLAVAVGLLFTPGVLAQECACTTVIGPDVSRIGADDAEPGDVLCLASGARGRLTLEGVVGTEAAPVVLTNCDGRVTFDDQIRVWGSAHVHITGTGADSEMWGIAIRAPLRAQAIDLSQLSTAIEIDHVEISASNFAGIMAKTDNADIQAFTQEGPRIHHNYVHDVNGEAFYVGNSFYGDTQAHSVVGVEVRDNIVINTGWDGIQVGAADEGAVIADNYIENTGIGTGDFQQRNGIQVGAGTRGRCTGNVIIRTGAHGIIVIGLGDTTVDNNLILEPSADGIWFSPRFHARAGEHPLGAMIHNTIVRPGGAGMEFHSVSATTENHMLNNLVAAPGGPPSDIHISLEVSELTSVYVETVEEAGFVSAIGYDDLQTIPVLERRQALIDAYGLSEGVEARDAGTAVSGFGITKDIRGAARSDGAPDIGAWEDGPLPGPGGGGGGVGGAGGRGADGGENGGEAGVGGRSPRDVSTPSSLAAGEGGGCTLPGAPARPIPGLGWGVLLALTALRRQGRRWRRGRSRVPLSSL
ncbi:MAG: right-handed parallel beta-helix repeat-containing protein [Myxococcota bacterium]